jgi:hypothetical protein
MTTRSRGTLRVGLIGLPALIVIALTCLNSPAVVVAFWVGGFCLLWGLVMLRAWFFFGNPEKVAAADERRKLAEERRRLAGKR